MLEVYTLIDTSVILSLGDAILGTVTASDIYILYFKPHSQTIVPMQHHAITCGAWFMAW